MKNPFTVTDMVVLAHPVIFTLLSVLLLGGILLAVAKCSRTIRIIAVLIGAVYALFIGWRVKAKTWLGASMLHFAIEDQKFVQAMDNQEETNKIQQVTSQ